MRPSQSKRLYDFLRSALNEALHHAEKMVSQQEQAIRETAQSREEKQTEIGSAIAVAIKAASDSVPQYEQGQRKKEHRLQWGLFWVTLFGALAATAAAIGAFYYARIANGQLKKMDDTYKEMRRQTYYSCLNGQAAQDAANQSRRAAIDSHAMAVASVQQALAAIEPQRAHLEIRFSVPKDLNTQTLDLPYTVHNIGKSDTPESSLNCKATLLNEGEKLIVNEEGEGHFIIGRLKGGGQYPEIPEAPYSPITPFIDVTDSKGNRIPLNSPAAKDYMAGKGGGHLVVIAQLIYSDFAGVHHDQICRVINLLKPGATAEYNKDPVYLACMKYNRADDAYSQISLPSLSVPADLPPITCVPPKE